MFFNFNKALINLYHVSDINYDVSFKWENDDSTCELDSVEISVHINGGNDCDNGKTYTKDFFTMEELSLFFNSLANELSKYDHEIARGFLNSTLNQFDSIKLFVDQSLNSKSEY